jgi:SAM-dependent methyltransferase
MKLSSALLSKRFEADGCAAIPLGEQERRALQRLNKSIEDGEIVLSSRSVCPLCKAGAGTVIGEKDRLGVPCRTVVCENCELLFNDSFLDEPSSSLFYEKYWRQIQWGSDPEKNFELRTRAGAYAWKRLAYVALNLGNRIGKISVVVEPGCGDGCNLLPYHLLGKRVVGCDYDESTLSPGRREGMHLIKGNTEELLKLRLKADLLILSHVAEHFVNVDSELERLRTILRAGGFVYVEVPGIRNMNRPRRKFLSEDGLRSTNDFLGYLQFQHNYHFELNTLKAFFERQGFQLITGDEWIRAIFRDVERSRIDLGTEDYRSSSNTIPYLQALERDYLSMKNKLLVTGKAVLARLSRHISPGWET